MIFFEVNTMEENENRLPMDTPVEEEAPKYTPRPRYQIVLAWVGVAIMVISVILYYAQIMHKY